MESSESLPAGARLPSQAEERPAERVLALPFPTTAAELIPVLLPLGSGHGAGRWLARLRRLGPGNIWRRIRSGVRK